MIMSEEDVERALRNVRIVEEAKSSNATRMDGCPLDQFIRNYVPDPNCVMGSWSDEVHRRKKWTEMETEYLLENYGRMSYLGIAAVLGKPYNAVVRKVGRMGLK